MKEKSKDRLHRVLVIGATPAGIAATNKLGEIGIPVTLVDTSPDLDQKMSKEEWRLASGQTLNYALRPGLLRILRNPAIRCLLSAQVTSLKHNPQGFRARLKCLPNFIDSDRCTLCGLCLEICPSAQSDGSQPILMKSRRNLPGRPVIDKRRTPPCQSHCPLNVNVQGYMALTKKGRFREALELIRKDNVLPGICGRICTHPCEVECRRKELDGPLAIRDIKRFLSDYELTHLPEETTTTRPHRSERIAVIGSGPAGLAASADLARLGYEVTVFEKEAEPGGLLRYGIGAYRLPREILDYEIDRIRRFGVQFRTANPIKLPGDLVGLTSSYAAVIVTPGTWQDRKLGVPGEDLEGVEGCLQFLQRFYKGEITEPLGKVAVIGDGNAAFDLARTLIRLKAEVTLLSWFPRELILADSDEIRSALEEGVILIDQTQVVGFSGQGGRLAELRCAHTKPGKPDAKGIPWPVILPEDPPFHLSFDRAFIAIGQKPNPMESAAKNFLKRTPEGFIQIDTFWRTNLPRVYAAGDAVTGPSSVVQAMESGRKAALAVHLELNGSEFQETQPCREEEKDFPPITKDTPPAVRVGMPEKKLGEQKNAFAETALGFDEAQTTSEALRCLQCGVCSECLQCEEVCRQVGAINHSATSSEEVEHAGVVIVADPEATPLIKGEDVIRAYGPKSRKTDVAAMILRGFAAAAQAMILLGGSSQRMKGHGLSFSPTDPSLAEDIRLGIFVCRCNDAFGWDKGMDAYITRLSSQPEVVHAETLISACTPEGSNGLVKTIREKGLTRVVLASCVCCPFNFICCACTDQRSRLKDALFKGTGISRSMVETCNLRGEVLWLRREYPEIALERFQGFIDRAIHRAKRLKTLPAPVRPYNFTTAVIGTSESAIHSALTLAKGGMEVILLGTPENPMPTTLIHPNIHHFEGSQVKDIRGTLGDFHVLIETGHFQQVLHVGALILEEKYRKHIPYTSSEDLPPRFVGSSMQERNASGIPFFYPGATSIAGLYLANPSGVRISERVKGAAAAMLAAAVMPRGPRYNKGYTVVVEESRCRGCGRCIKVCPYQAVKFKKNPVGGWCAAVDEALCKGCGNCISVCPSNAADSPYRNQEFLEQILEQILSPGSA
jgi:NADPH-dependent glutamate synthase beta subunit-like oxidoreductase/NAD-dependent dihydropyrimidine dehydrogenase PreA subunit